MREAYRLNKHQLYAHINQGNEQYAIALLYLEGQILNFEAIEIAVKNTIGTFIERTS